MYDLSAEQAELLTRVADAYQHRDENGQREDIGFSTAMGSVGTTMWHSAIPEDHEALDLGDMQDLEDQGFLRVGYGNNEFEGSFRVTDLGFKAVAAIREQEQALSEPAVIPAESKTMGLDWQSEVQPVLMAVHELFPASPPHRGVSQQAINHRLGREEDDPRTGRVLRKLEEAEYIIGKLGTAAQIDGPLFCEPGPKALELLAGWPTDRGDALLARLIEGLEARIEATPDEAERSKLRGVLESVRGVGQGVMVAVLTDLITGGG